MRAGDTLARGSSAARLMASDDARRFSRRFRVSSAAGAPPPPHPHTRPRRDRGVRAPGVPEREGRLQLDHRLGFSLGRGAWLIYGWDAIRAGVAPLWCPFVAAGSPFYLNPQTQIHSPLSLLLGGPVRVLVPDGSVAHADADAAGLGSGAYALAFSVWRERMPALLAGLCYQLCGVLYGHLSDSTDACVVRLGAVALPVAGAGARPALALGAAAAGRGRCSGYSRQGTPASS